MTGASAPTKQVAVVGLGAWGSALALHCARLGHSVIGWNHNTEAVQEITRNRRLSIAGQSASLPAHLKVTSNLADLVESDLTIVALPAKAWGEVLPQLKTKYLISATKGLEKESALTPLVYAQRTLGYSTDRLCVISGPSFASDLCAGRPISLVAASTSEQFANTVASSLSSPTVRIYSSSDPIGVELGGILKNIIAIAAGVSDSLGYGPSARAALISRGLYEMTCIATTLGADARTLTGLSGLGDLVMTATEDQSRNRTVGLRLGKGEKLSDILVSLGATAEGVTSGPLAHEVARKNNIPHPITEHVVKLMNGEIRATDLAAALMTRPLKREF